MKWAVIIWTFYLMALTLMPCSDYLNRCESPNDKTELTTQSHDHNQDSDDSCTPFCHCSCCSATIFLADIDVNPHFVKSPIYLSSKKVALSDASLISAYSGSVWQPPKINA